MITIKQMQQQIDFLQKVMADDLFLLYNRHLSLLTDLNEENKKAIAQLFHTCQKYLKTLEALVTPNITQATAESKGHLIDPQLIDSQQEKGFEQTKQLLLDSITNTTRKIFTSAFANLTGSSSLINGQLSDFAQVLGEASSTSTSMSGMLEEFVLQNLCLARDTTKAWYMRDRLSNIVERFLNHLSTLQVTSENEGICREGRTWCENFVKALQNKQFDNLQTQTTQFISIVSALIDTQTKKTSQLSAEELKKYEACEQLLYLARSLDKFNQYIAVNEPKYLNGEFCNTHPINASDLLADFKDTLGSSQKLVQTLLFVRLYYKHHLAKERILDSQLSTQFDSFANKFSSRIIQADGKPSAEDQYCIWQFLPSGWQKDPYCIFGDIHGDLETLIRGVIEAIKNGQKFIFCGDYIDRGLYSTETLIFLMVLLVQYPENVVISRGNHEQNAIEDSQSLQMLNAQANDQTPPRDQELYSQIVGKTIWVPFETGYKAATIDPSFKIPVSGEMPGSETIIEMYRAYVEMDEMQRKKFFLNIIEMLKQLPSGAYLPQSASKPNTILVHGGIDLENITVPKTAEEQKALVAALLKQPMVKTLYLDLHESFFDKPLIPREGGQYFGEKTLENLAELGILRLFRGHIHENSGTAMEFPKLSQKPEIWVTTINSNLLTSDMATVMLVQENGKCRYACKFKTDRPQREIVFTLQSSDDFPRLFRAIGSQASLNIIAEILASYWIDGGDINKVMQAANGRFTTSYVKNAAAMIADYIKIWGEINEEYVGKIVQKAIKAITSGIEDMLNPRAGIIPIPILMLPNTNTVKKWRSNNEEVLCAAVINKLGIAMKPAVATFPAIAPTFQPDQKHTLFVSDGNKKRGEFDGINDENNQLLNQKPRKLRAKDKSFIPAPLPLQPIFCT